MKTVLIIEDDADLRQHVAEIVKSEKYAVITAANGHVGVELAIKKQPNIILCDMQMPEMNGFEVIDLLKKSINTSHIPFVFVSSKAEKEDIQAGLDKGANAYLCKPFSRAQLLKELERFT